MHEYTRTPMYENERFVCRQIHSNEEPRDPICDLLSFRSANTILTFNFMFEKLKVLYKNSLTPSTVN
jgi:hypothetical protein